MRRFYLIAILSSIVFQPVVSQVNRDSLLLIWENPDLHDTVRYQAFHKFISRSFMPKYPDSILYYGKIYHDSAVAWESIRYQGNSLYIMAQGNMYKGDYPKANEQITRAIELFESIDRMYNGGFLLYNHGLIQYMMGNVANGHKIMDAAIENGLTYNKKDMAAECAIMKGRAYTMVGDKIAALEEIEFALEILKEIEYKDGIANAYISLGDLYLDLGEHQKALGYFDRSEKLYLEIDKKKYAEAATTRKGIALLKLKRYDEALPLPANHR